MPTTCDHLGVKLSTNLVTGREVLRLGKVSFSNSTIGNRKLCQKQRTFIPAVDKLNAIPEDGIVWYYSMMDFGHP